VGLFTWNPDEAPDELNFRFSNLKAMEWCNLPLFLAQVIAPLLMLWLPWWSIALGTWVLQLCWNTVRYRLLGIGFEPNPESSLTSESAVNPVFGQSMLDSKNLITFACTVGMIVKLKWLISITAGTFLFTQGETGQALAALLWPVLTLILIAFSGGCLIGIVQKRFLLEMGFVPVTGDPGSCLIEDFRRF
jgi:hypothetical protein